MLLADAMWNAVEAGGTVDVPEVAVALDDALTRSADEFTAILGLLSEAQARVARLVAWGEPLTGAAARRLSLSQGSARSAAAALVDRGLLHLEDRRHSAVDPLLAEYLRRLGPNP